MKQVRATLTRLADGAINGDQRAQYNTQYNLLRTQIADFITDATYNGRTLLSTLAAAPGGATGGNITGIRNEGGGTFTIDAVDGDTFNLTSVPVAATDAQAMIASGGEFDLVDADISTALNQFGASMQYVENQIIYNSKKVDAMNSGLGALVDADLARESSRLQALQTRQQLGIQTLGIANQGPQILLSLFR
jgi:flagellin